MLPAQGMIEFRDTLTGLIDEFGKGDEEDPYDLPKPAIIGDKKSKQVKFSSFSRNFKLL